MVAQWRRVGVVEAAAWPRMVVEAAQRQRVAMR